MPLDVVSATLVKKSQMTPDVFDLIFRTHRPFRFKAGQFVSIRFPAEKPPFYRPYSIAGRPHSDDSTVQICIKKIADGPASTYICDLEEGAEVELKGPSGVFLANQPNVNRYYFITTGTGIAPLKAMIEDLLLNQGNATTPIFLLFGFRNQRDMFYVDHFDALESQFPNFRYVTTLSKPDPDWRGHRGRVTDYLNTHLTTPLENQYYLCGIGEMIKDVRTMLTEKGVPKESIHYERFT